MYVEVTGEPSTVTVHEPNDLKSFAVQAPGLTAEQLDAVLIAQHAGKVASTPPEHCWISVDFVRSAARPVVDSTWSAQFDALLTYAAGKGWLDASGDNILGHVVTAGPE